MKRIDLTRHLEKSGLQRMREGRQHSLTSPPNQEIRPPCRVHREIPQGTVRSICRALEFRRRSEPPRREIE